MKNKEYIYIIMITILLIIVTIINFFVFGFNSLNGRILNKKWYHYNYSNGYYDILTINKDKINYNSFDENNNFNNCFTYNYDKKKDTIIMDCNHTIEISRVNDNNIELKIDNYDKTFFNNIEDSLNYEFKNYFGKSIVDFKDEKNQVTEYSKINSNKLINVMQEKGYSKIIFMGNNCTSVDCILALDIMEKWIIKSNNIFYFDSNELDNNLLNTISSKIKDFNKDINFYNGIYPKVLVTKNGRIIDNYDIKCNGFNCNSISKNEF